jgi:hypothetical protein
VEEIKQEIIKRLVRDQLDGMSFSEIRKRLLEEGWSEEGVRDLIREVDKRVLEAAVNEGRQDKNRQINRIGLILAVAGLAISIGFNRGLILQRLPAVVVYTPFFLGILVMFYARMTRGRTMTNRDNRSGPIRKRRPFK